MFSSRPPACASARRFLTFRSLSLRIHTIAAASLATLPVLGVAQSSTPPATPSLAPVVVTATRGETPASSVIADVTVIDRARIEASAARTLTDLLAQVPGVQITGNGGAGKASGVFVRGAEARHTLLLVDGVRFVSATTGTPAWENIPLETIERIEVLRGPASALYGSDAVGGVVQVFMRKGREGTHPRAALTTGSRGRVEASTGVQSGTGGLTYQLGARHFRERGISSTNERETFGNFDPDRDPFRQNAIDASAAWKLGGDASIDASMLATDGRTAYDEGLGVDAKSVIRAFVGQVGGKVRLAPTWETEARVSEAKDIADSIVSNFPGAFRTRESQLSWTHRIATPLGRALAGLERRTQRVSGSTAYDVTRRTIDAAFAGLDGTAGAHSWQGNVRHDSNSQFGGRTTGFAGYGLKLAEAWRMSASYGTSFVAPSFNQLYYPEFGNPDLQPERGRNLDLGLAWRAAGHEVKLTRFDNRIRGFITSSTRPENLPRARIDGWSLDYGGRLGDFALRASVDRLDPVNELTGARLPRRAKSQATLGADWSGGVWRFGADALRVGPRFEDTRNTQPLAGYTTLGAYAEWRATRSLSVLARLDNLTNRRYETALGYNTYGRSAFLTLRWQPE